MTSITAITSSPPPVAAGAAAAASSATPANVTQQQPLASASAAAGRTSFNPRLYEDPSAGGVIVTQYLSVNGAVVSQFPSTAVIAYLRQGLTADGQVKGAVDHSEPATQATVA